MAVIYVFRRHFYNFAEPRISNFENKNTVLLVLFQCYVHEGVQKKSRMILVF